MNAKRSEQVRGAAQRALLSRALRFADAEDKAMESGSLLDAIQALRAGMRYYRAVRLADRGGTQ